jgi:hypothetical protein
MAGAEGSRAAARLRRWLQHPLTVGIDVDDPRTTAFRRQIIRENSFLCRIYADWHARLATDLPPGPLPALELGTGATSLRDVVPRLITSEVFPCPDVDLVLSATRLPFAAASLRGIVMTDVLHHVRGVRELFGEAARCVVPGGVIAMIEPWVTTWSRFVYTRLHHEPFRPDAPDWDIPAGGPLSGANGALPWIVFERDRAQFAREFPEWRIDRVDLFMPFRYLVSGGVSMQQLMPGWSHAAWLAAERGLRPWMRSLAMFAHIKITRLPIAS